MALEGRELLSTLTVSNTYDSGPGSLRAAVAQANADGGGDTIVFSSLFSAPQTITLTSGQLELIGTKAGTTITGPGASLLSVGGHDASRVFQVDANVTASISGLTITGGRAGAYDIGGGLYNAGVISFAAPSAGALATLSADTADIDNGQASVTATANATSGKYSVTASASGAGSTSFALANTKAPGVEGGTPSPIAVKVNDGLTGLRKATKRLQGTWTAIEAERDGGAADDVVGHRLSFTGDCFRIRSAAGTLLYAGTVRVDPSTKPAAIDFELTKGAPRGTVWKGIYALDGDTLTTCDNAPDPDKGRPTTFEAERGCGYVLITFRRAKP
jgi:uncharacterized protein (TIGR03067 family)